MNNQGIGESLSAAVSSILRGFYSGIISICMSPTHKTGLVP